MQRVSINKGPMMSKLRFLTLGPEGTNHELVTKRYLTFHGIQDVALELIDDFHLGLAMIRDGCSDFMIQAAAHPDCGDVIGKGSFHFDVHVVDTFISPSRQLGILTQADIEKPKTIGFHPATKGYADLSAWRHHQHMPSNVAVSEGLVSRELESGIAFLDLNEQYPGRFRIDLNIGTADDAWIVYGRERIANGSAIIWANSPFKERLNASTILK